ncbi:MAG: hypothetical protein RLZZ127_548 [Planctomycetota bacterium]|jgi:uncharacterized protein (DUF58 family)
MTRPLRPGRRLTPVGWWALAAGTALVLAPWWSGHGAPAVLGLCLLAALALALLLVGRGTGAVAAVWQPGDPPRAGGEGRLRLRLEPGTAACPVEVWCPDPAGGSRRAARLGGLERPRPVAVALHFPKRGRQMLAPPLVACRLPFGLVEAVAPAGPAGEVLVLPAPGRLREDLARQVTSHLAASAADGGADDEPDRLRPYRSGDPPRAVHWRASARAGSLLVCQRRGGAGRICHVRVDPAPPPGGDRDGRRHDRLCSAAAAVVEHLAGLGWSVHLAGPGLHPCSGDLRRLLASLALAEPASGDALLGAPPGTILLAHRAPAETPPGVLVLAGEPLFAAVSFQPRAAAARRGRR